MFRYLIQPHPIVHNPSAYSTFCIQNIELQQLQWCTSHPLTSLQSVPVQPPNIHNKSIQYARSSHLKRIDKKTPRKNANQKPPHSLIPFVNQVKHLYQHHHYRTMYLKSGKPAMMLRIISSSSTLRFCTEFVAPVNGCGGGGVTLCTGGRAKGAGLGSGVGLLGGAGVSKMDQGSEGSGGVGWGMGVDVVGTEDSNMEKSQESAGG